MERFKIDRNTAEQGEIWTIGFGAPSTNDQITREVEAHLKDNPPKGGRLLLIDGPASLPVSFVLCHGVAHLYGAVAVKDPKLGKFVVAVSHDPDHKIGDLV